MHRSRDGTAYVLPRVELRASLADNYVARDDILIWSGQQGIQPLEKLRYVPENFFKPRRFPGEPP